MKFHFLNSRPTCVKATPPSSPEMRANFEISEILKPFARKFHEYRPTNDILEMRRDCMTPGLPVNMYEDHLPDEFECNGNVDNAEFGILSTSPDFSLEF
jgi:hypothetical protein